MTYIEMLLRIFRANLRRYTLFFACSSFAVMVYFMFTSLATNPAFSDMNVVTSRISSGLYAPKWATAFFSVIFIVYAQSAFVKFRKKDFGMFMVLGMTRGDVRKIIVFENAAIGLASIMTGLVTGTLASYLFYLLAMKITALQNVPFALTPESYLHTGAFFAAIYAVVITGSLVVSSRYRIINLLKESRVRDRSWLENSVSGIFGVVLTGYGVVDMISHYAGDEGALPRSLVLLYTGIYFILSSLPGWIDRVYKRSPSLYYRSLMARSELNYTFGQSKKIHLLISILVTVTIFLSSLALLLNSQSLNAATLDNPDQLFYAERFGKNALPEAELNAIIGTEAFVSHKKMNYIDQGPYKMISASEMNAVLGTSFQISIGHFLSVSQIRSDDGYDHENVDLKKFKVPMKSGSLALSSQGSEQKIWFSTPILMKGGILLIVNDEDYRKIELDQPAAVGLIHLINFKDWRQTEGVYHRLNTALAQYNKAHTEPMYDDPRLEERVFAAGSRIADYMEIRQSASFLLLVLVFMGLLFFMSSCVILHFRVLTELERDRVKYGKLNKIGITAGETARMVRDSFRVLFFAPYIVAIIVSAFYTTATVYMSMNQWISPLRYSLLTGAAFMAFQWLYYMLYTRWYIRKMLRFMGL
ncbi:FtsX-like permease family protein [Paenibacillus sp. sgz500958]|uniref:FtsX-like permease family protein n=1 Tax=Paenibacillus sp. sgz500958 TaxID=3242475 RepID=UPI0036D43FC0